MAEDLKQNAVGDAGDPRTMEIDRNGPRTAVGVPHPENRPEGQTVPAIDMSGFELDDYDDDNQREPLVTDLPADQDAGESFRDIVDVGEVPQQHRERVDEEPAPDMTPTVDNQLNQPDRFHNREPKGRAG
jgi:hypothetical protein